MTQTSNTSPMSKAAPVGTAIDDGSSAAVGEMNNFQMFLLARADFPPFRGPDQVWAEFQAWWRQRWPSRQLPAEHGPHNLRALTGLSDEYLRRRLLDKWSQADNDAPLS
jgi:hypothetical protein